MSRPTYSAAGALSYLGVDICVCRWGGGAGFGKYHVYVSGPTTWGNRGVFPIVSIQCVVDDFGNLVEARQ